MTKQDINMIKQEIRNWKTGVVIYECEADTLKEAVKKAVKEGVNLSFADLRGVDLDNVNLHGADLSGADLSFADLTGANLRGVNFRGANLFNTNLQDVVGFSTADWHNANFGQNLSQVEREVLKKHIRGRNTSRIIQH